MAGKDDRTEAPTPKKKRDARKKGQVARSPDLVAWTQMFAASFLLPATVSGVGGSVQVLSSRLTEAVAEPEPGAALALFGEGLKSAMLGLVPLVGGLMAIGLVGHLAMTGGLVAPSLLKPKSERINPFKGIKRLLSPASAWEAVKVLAKSAVLVAVAWGPLSGMTARLVAMGQPDVATILAEVGSTAMTLLRNTAGAGLVLAAVDYGLQKRRVRKGMMMTKQEVRDEHRQSEGDPQMKGAIRQRQQEMSRNRMMADVATANVVVVNPTHVAVALRYDPANGAPRVVAKGQGVVAARIREEAEEHRVPLVRDVPLARTLHSSCEIGQEIPAELFEAVARLLAYVFTLDRRVIGSGSVLPSPPAPAPARS